MSQNKKEAVDGSEMDNINNNTLNQIKPTTNNTDAESEKLKDDRSQSNKKNKENIMQRTDMQDLPLRIAITLGSFVINANDPVDLVVGKTIKIDSEMPGFVKLDYQGHEIGWAELISVDGHLAIRIKKRWGS